MHRIGTLIGLLALASCSPADSPPTATPPRKTTPLPAPPPKSPPAPPQEPAPPPVAPLSEPPRPKFTVRRPDVPPPGVPRASGLTGDIHLPAFTFRALSSAGQILINGEFLGATPCLWSVTDALAFDPKIRVEPWPPEGVVKIGSSSHPEKGSAEIYVDQSDDLVARFPHLRPGESILYVDGTIGGRRVRGGLRLLVEGYKYVVYTPLVDPEGDEASRYLRSIWFDRKQNE